MDMIRSGSSFKIYSPFFLRPASTSSFYFFSESFFYGARKREEQLVNLLLERFQRECKRSIGCYMGFINSALRKIFEISLQFFRSLRNSYEGEIYHYINLEN